MAQINSAEKKVKALLIGILILVLWCMVPTGTPDDVFTFWLYSMLGAQWSVLIIIIAIGSLMYLGMTPNKVKNKVKQWLKGITR